MHEHSLRLYICASIMYEPYPPLSLYYILIRV